MSDTIKFNNLEQANDWIEKLTEGVQKRALQNKELREENERLREALKDWYKENEIDELAHGTTIDIISELSFGYFEPSERGAGIAFKEDRIEAVEDIVKTLLTEAFKGLKGE